MNADADLALSLPDDPEKRTPMSDPASYNDNFNKNSPPPTLGKRLVTPNSSEQVEQQLASPSGLLPPLNFQR